MTEKQKEKAALLFRLETLKILLDFRVKNSKYSFKSQKEFDDYVDALLDEINEVRNSLKSFEP